MACELCGRMSCTRSFHTLEEQNQFDSYADEVKERMKEVLKYKINRLQDKGKDMEYYLVDISEVIDIIDNYY